MSLSKPTFYLAHPILSRKLVREWELKVEKEIGIVLKNPFYDGKGYETGNIKKVDSGQLDIYDRRLDSKLLVETDLDSIDSCVGVLAICDDNLTIGTPMELMYAKMHGIPIITICTNTKTQYHPWLRYCSDETFRSYLAFEDWAKAEYDIFSQKGIRVGFSGKSRSGKSSIAKMLNTNFQFAFADELKDTIQRVFGLDREQLSRKLPAVRKTLQRFGTEAVRNIFPDAWVTCLERKLGRYEKVFPTYGMVVSDIRFLNEAEMLHRRGYKIVRIFRPGEDFQSNLHSSETELDNLEMDSLIVNNGSLEQLQKKADKLYKWLLMDMCTK